MSGWMILLLILMVLLWIGVPGVIVVFYHVEQRAIRNENKWGDDD